jgi:hypothetical protein
MRAFVKETYARSPVIQATKLAQLEQGEKWGRKVYDVTKHWRDDDAQDANLEAWQIGDDVISAGDRAERAQQKAPVKVEIVDPSRGNPISRSNAGNPDESGER